MCYHLFVAQYRLIDDLFSLLYRKLIKVVAKTIELH